MTPEETKTYIERRLREVGWEVHIPSAGYDRIQSYTAGQEDRLNHLYYKLVSIGSQQPKREVSEQVVTLAIDELKKMDELLERAGLRPGKNENIDADRQSIEQLAAALEQKMAGDSAAGKKDKRNNATAPGGAAMAATNEATAKASAGRLPKMLVVDDSATIRAVVTKALSHDFTMVEASDGEQAWKLLKADPTIEMVVTDLMMPNLDGYGLINRIRADQSSPRFAEMPIIVVTALADANSKLKALVAGANDFITKNTDALEMQARVMARYKLAQTTAASSHAHHRHVAAQPAATHAQTQAAGHGATVAHAHAVRAAAGAAKPRAIEPVRPAPEAARAGAPRAAAPRPAPPPTLKNVVALHPALAKVRDVVVPLRDRLMALGPTTLVTLGATALFIVVVSVIFYVNRMSPKPEPVQVAQSDSAALNDPMTDPRAEAMSRPAPSQPARPEPAKPAAGMTTQPNLFARPAEAPKPAAAAPAPPAAPSAPAPAPASGAPAEASTSAAAGAATVAAGAAVVTATATPPSPEPAAAPPAVEQVASAPAEVRRADPAAAKPPANRITQAELANLLRRFAFVYEAGDVDQFVELFDEDVRTNDRSTKAGLREDYENLFKNSVNRQMLLGNVAWEINDKQANGWGNFEVRIKRVGDEDVKAFKGSLTFQVEKADGRLRIKRMYHGQYRAGG